MISQIKKEAIRQRLMYSFGFTYEQANKELDFLFINGVFTTEHYYSVIQRRIGATKTLMRSEKVNLHKYVDAIIVEE